MAAIRALTDAQEHDITTRYGKGCLTAHLADEFSVSGATIRNAIKRCGGVLRPRGGVPGVSKVIYAQ